LRREAERQRREAEEREKERRRREEEEKARKRDPNSWTPIVFVSFAKVTIYSSCGCSSHIEFYKKK